MAEEFPSATELRAKSNATDTDTGLHWLERLKDPHDDELYQMQWQLLYRGCSALQVYKDSSDDLKFGVRSGYFFDGDALRTYAGATAQSVSNNATNYIYLTADGTLTVNTTGFPTPSETPHIRLATIAAGTASDSGTSGDYHPDPAEGDVVDYRWSSMFRILGSAGGGAVTVYNGTGGEIAAGSLLHVAGYDDTNDCLEVEKADADTAGKPAHLVANEAIADSSTGEAVRAYTLTAQNTDGASAVGDPVYLSATAGGWTLTAPSGADQVAHLVGHVTAKHATTGVVALRPGLLGPPAVTGTSGLQDLSVSNAKLAGSIARTKLAEEELARYQVPLTSVRSEDGTAIDASGGAGKFWVMAPGWGTGTVLLNGEDSESETEVSGFCFEFVLPPEYVADADVQLVVHGKLDESGGGSGGTCTIDAEVYEMGDDGTVGSDLCDTSAITLTSSFADRTFTVIDTGLVAGDRLMVIVRTSIEETSGLGPVKAVIGSIEMQLDIKG